MDPGTAGAYQHYYAVDGKPRLETKLISWLSSRLNDARVGLNDARVAWPGLLLLVNAVLKIGRDGLKPGNKLI